MENKKSLWETLFNKASAIRTWGFALLAITACLTARSAVRRFDGRMAKETYNQLFEYPFFAFLITAGLILVLAEILKKYRRIPDGQPVFVDVENFPNRVGLILSFIFCPMLGWLFGAFVGFTFYK